MGGLTLDADGKPAEELEREEPDPLQSEIFSPYGLSDDQKDFIAAVQDLTTKGTRKLAPEEFDGLAVLYHEFSEYEQSCMAPHLAECGHVAAALFDRDIGVYNQRVVSDEDSA
jgi:hypothetical protein